MFIWLLSGIEGRTFWDVIVLLSAIKSSEQVAKHPEESKPTANDTRQLLYFEDLPGQTVKTRRVYDRRGAWAASNASCPVLLTQRNVPDSWKVPTQLGMWREVRNTALNKELFRSVCNMGPVKRPKRRVNSVSVRFFLPCSLPSCIRFKVYQGLELNPSKRSLDIQGCPSAKRGFAFVNIALGWRKERESPDWPWTFIKVIQFVLVCYFFIKATPGMFLILSCASLEKSFHKQTKASAELAQQLPFLKWCGNARLQTSFVLWPAKLRR